MPSHIGKTSVPLFLSWRSLREVRLPNWSEGPWALDSGGFSELSLFGTWTIPYREYADGVRIASKRIGLMRWAAIQDWMCEDPIRAKTGLTTLQHQLLTVQSLIDLRTYAPDIAWAPVLQGQEPWEYYRHYELYAAAGFNLRDEKIVGLGSVCRRQNISELRPILDRLAPLSLRLHGFGIKQTGLTWCKDRLESSDSLAWSFTARREKIRLPGHRHANCANCLEFALLWRTEMLRRTGVSDSA